MHFILKIIFLYTVFFFNLTISVFAQITIDTASIKDQLFFILERDQKPRKSGDSIQFINYIDSTNLIILESIVEKYGWPGRSFVGAKGNNTAWLVIQHADLQTQEKYFPLIKKSVDLGESRKVDLALLEDRILMRKGEKQKYGSQIRMNPKTGAQEIWPIEDEKNVNKRRSEIGLEPMEDYAKRFGIEYTLPEK
jgi:hypothetical protein